MPPQEDQANLAELIRSALQAPARDVPLVRWRVRNTLRRQDERRRRLLRVVLVGSLLFLAGSVVGAVMGPILVSRGKSKAPARVDMVAANTRALHKRSRTPAPLPSKEALEVVPSTSGSLAPAEQPAPSEAPENTARTTPGAPAVIAPRLAPGMVTKSALQRAPSPRVARVAHHEAGVPAESPRRLAYAIPVTSPHPRVRAAAAPAVSGVPTIPSASPGATELSPPAPVLQTVPAPNATQNATPSKTPSLPTPALVRQLALRDHPTVLADPSRAHDGLGPTPAISSSRVSNAVARPAAAQVEKLAGLASEQALLTKALRSLRSVHDANAALVALDDYGARFPSGVLAPEAARLRTEALLLLGRKPAALAVLERDGQIGMPSGDDRRLLRGELRAAAGRWRAAAEDFDAVLHSDATGGPVADAKSSERLERALWGRASARSHLGDEASARSDLQEYLRRFPRGRFAADAARLVGKWR